MLCIESLRLRHCSPDPPGRADGTGNTRVPAGGTLIRRYVLALTQGRAGKQAAIKTIAVPPLSGGPGQHDSEATHAATIADSARARSRQRSAFDTLAESGRLTTLRTGSLLAGKN